MMRNLYSVPNEDIGKQKIISGTTTANALVALKNPGGSHVAFTTADANGHYAFTIDANIPMQVEVAASADPTATAVAAATNGPLGCVVYCMTRMISNNGPFWAGAPSLSFVDRTGSGAAAQAVMCSVGGTYKYYEYAATLDGLKGGVGAPVVGIVITSIGENYSGPSNNSTVNPPYYGMRVVGNQVLGPLANVDPNNPPPGAFEYDNSWYMLQSEDYIVFSDIFSSAYIKRDITGPNWYAGVYNNLAQAAGAGHGAYSYSYISGSLPTFTNVTPPAGDAGSGQNLINLVRNGFNSLEFSDGPYYKGYRAIIYGQNPNNIDDIGFPEGLTGAIVKPDGAVDAYNRGIISRQELDVLKGYFGKEMLVGGVLATSNQLTKQIVSTVLLFAWNIMQGLAVTRVSAEMLSVARQGKGVEITDMQGRVKPILDKMQNGTGNHYINNLQVRDGNNVVHQWNFTGSAPTKTVP